MNAASVGKEWGSRVKRMGDTRGEGERVGGREGKGVAGRKQGVGGWVPLTSRELRNL